MKQEREKKQEKKLIRRKGIGIGMNTRKKREKKRGRTGGTKRKQDWLDWFEGGRKKDCLLV